MNTIVYTGGTFDLFHFGHLNLLQACHRLGDRVVVGLNTDEFVIRYKGRRPLWTYDQRKIMLEACRYVDEVVPNLDGEDSKPVLLKVRPQLLVIGSDWACKDYYKQMGFTQQWLDTRGIQLVYVPYTEGMSSTQLREHFKEIRCVCDRKTAAGAHGSAEDGCAQSGGEAAGPAV